MNLKKKLNHFFCVLAKLFVYRCSFICLCVGLKVDFCRRRRRRQRRATIKVV